jgi:predicted nucleic acid-binding protein
MPGAITNTSPVLYLGRIGALGWLPQIFDSVWIPSAVIDELDQGRVRGVDVPSLTGFPWLKTVDPASTPSEWLTLDLGSGELAAMALALENPERVILLDDALARRAARAAGLTTWGTLRILLEAKTSRLVPTVAPFVDRLAASGMWMSPEIRRRVLSLAGEDDTG